MEKLYEKEMGAVVGREERGMQDREEIGEGGKERKGKEGIKGEAHKEKREEVGMGIEN